jgi:hypothetical protein
MGIRVKSPPESRRQKLNNELNPPSGADSTVNIDFGLQMGEITVT